MPSASKMSTPVAVDLDEIQGRYAPLGVYTVAFETFKQDVDPAPLFVGLPGDRCQCEHWGVVTEGQLTFRWVDHEETYVEGEHAEVLLQSPVKGVQALLTAEGEKVLSYRLVDVVDIEQELDDETEEQQDTLLDATLVAETLERLREEVDELARLVGIARTTLATGKEAKLEALESCLKRAEFAELIVELELVARALGDKVKDVRTVHHRAEADTHRVAARAAVCDVDGVEALGETGFHD